MTSTMSDVATLTVQYRGRSASVALRADTAEYLTDTPRPTVTDWRVADVILAVWAAFQAVKDKA